MTAAKVDAVDPQKKAQAVDTAAERKAAVIREQRQKWAGFREEIQAALAANDFDRLKCLKSASESLNIQECEDRAWGIQDKAEAGMPTTMTIRWQRG